MNAIHFDGSAVRRLKQHGISGLREYKNQSSWKPAFDDVDRLNEISQDSHKLVPRNLYYKCADMHETQAALTRGNVDLIEADADVSPAAKKKIEQLRMIYKKHIAAAQDARQLGYARRSTLHHWFACRIPKDYRDHFTISLTLIGFGINLVWFAYLGYLMMQRRKDKQNHATSKNGNSNDSM